MQPLPPVIPVQGSTSNDMVRFERWVAEERAERLERELRECRERCARLRSALASQPGWSHERVKQIEEGQIGE